MQAPYGSWTSPISTDLIVAESIGLGSAQFSGQHQYWIEARPQEGGRMVVVRRSHDGTTHDVNPAPYNVRSRVHEYGGAAALIYDNSLYFTNFQDQQVYRQLLGEEPLQLTRAPTMRFANGVMDLARQRLIYVVEEHAPKQAEAKNFLGAVELATGSVRVLAQGHDFYSSPVLSPDGRQLAFMTWDHPQMPWDGTDLWLATIAADGSLQALNHVAGGDEEAVQQPRFSPDGHLYFVSDRTGWWNLYRQDASGETEIVCERQSEFGVPQWALGPCTYAFRSATEIICIENVRNEKTLSRLSVATGEMTPLALPFTEFGGLSIKGNLCTLIASSATTFAAVVNVNLDNGNWQTIKRGCEIELDPGYYAVPEAIEYPTADGETAHAFYYPPANKDCEAAPGSLPPLVVMLHGGPTAASNTGLDLANQFWTSRGFAVLDVNYRGSTGYGREYRRKLNRAWGIVDVEDTVHGARYLVERKLADPARLAIRGGSAGGYTTLAALTFTDTFSAGASYYGIGDLEALVKDTHKFESRYCDSMIGAYPEEIAIYEARSPLNHVDQLSCPVIFFQGAEDKVVPPNQAESMVAALTEKGIPVAYVPFAGEQHGFRRAENIKRALDLELFFYARIFGISVADQIEPIEIINLPSS